MQNGNANNSDMPTLFKIKTINAENTPMVSPNLSNDSHEEFRIAN